MKKADPNGVERYYFEVTVTDVAAYLPDYNIHYGSHKIRDGQPETLTLTFWLYDSGSWGQWSAQTVDVECVKEPVGEPSLSGLKIKVACVENKSGHKTEGQHYGLDHYKNYTTSNANGIYTITVDKAFYIGRYTNTTKVTHTEAGENSNEIKWQWTGEEWKLLNEKDNKGGVLTINVKCEKEEPKPEYAVTYNYDDSVPDEVKKTLPTDSMKYPVGEEVTVLAPTSTEVIAKGCIWKFKTWKLDEEVEPEAKVPMVEGGLKFHGIWESTPIAPTEKYTLTINYVDQYNRKLHGSYTGQYVENELYSVRSPEIYGYRTYDTVVEGKMPARNVTINVVYYVEQIFPGGMWPTYPPHVKKDEKPQVTEEVSENPLKFDTIHHFAYVNGYPDGLVRPENDITRAEVAAILYRLMEESSVAKFYKASCGFYDVAADAWYSTYVSTLDNAGVITDSASGYFRPDEAITRAELAAMLAPFATVTDAKNTFSDVSDSHWAADAIAVCAKMGWIKGYPDGTFRPDQTITRAEMMAMVNRALDRTPQTVEDLLPDMKTWADNADTDMWYYLDVQEATNSHTYVKSDAHETWEKLIPDMGF